MRYPSQIKKILYSLQDKSRCKRKRIFLNQFSLHKDIKILDLGGWDGKYIANILEDQDVLCKNVYIADIDHKAVFKAQEQYGFKAIHLCEHETLPFPNDFFDIVFCSSVIEHVTFPKKDIWKIRSGEQFRKVAMQKQHQFASEIRRIGKNYFIQTPYRWFPFETHVQLPFVNYLPRSYALGLIKWTNRYWIKKTQPDWNLLSKSNLGELFPDGKFFQEKFLFLTKSLIIVKNNYPGCLTSSQ